MATSWGIDPLKDSNGVVQIGTTADDFRKIQGGLYTPGLISGGKVTTSASALTYTVSGGVAAFPIVTSGVPQTVLGAIPATVLSTSAAVSGTRMDLIYAQQRTVAVEGDPNIIVAVGTSLPDRAVLLDGFIVGTTTASTTAATRSADIKYSIPYGASLGRLVNMTSMFNSNFAIAASGTQPRSSLGSATYYLPTDRLIRISLTATASANGAIGFDNSKYCEAGYEVLIDNVIQFTWTTGGLHQSWEENNWDGYIQHSAGSHTITVRHFRASGPGTPRGRALTGQPYARVIVEDIGPVV